MTTIIGILAGWVCVVLSIVTSGDLMSFVDIPSVFITVGGVICVTFASFPVDRHINLFKALKNVYQKVPANMIQQIDMLIGLANIARREGILALEDSANEAEDPFLKKGIMLIVDGTDPDLLKDIMDTELAFVKQRHTDSRTILEAAAAYSPAFGMIGTLIGLINMLKGLSDMASVGPNMAVALITTFYGSAMANLIFLPLSKKLKAAGSQEYLRKELIVEALLSIQNGENPRIIREKLYAFLPASLVAKANASAEAAKEE